MLFIIIQNAEICSELQQFRRVFNSNEELKSDMKTLDLEIDSQQIEELKYQDDFIIQNTIGEGAFGVVSRGILSPNSKAKFKSIEFAIKKFNQDYAHELKKRNCSRTCCTVTIKAF